MSVARSGGVASAAPTSPPPEGGGLGCPAMGVDLDYVGTLTVEARSDLFVLAALLRYVLRRQGKEARHVRKVPGCSKLGALLALNDARRPTLATLFALADEIDVPHYVIRDILAACPAAIAPERSHDCD